jgi:hypothetical protein
VDWLIFTLYVGFIMRASCMVATPIQGSLTLPPSYLVQIPRYGLSLGYKSKSLESPVQFRFTPYRWRLSSTWLITGGVDHRELLSSQLGNL